MEEMRQSNESQEQRTLAWFRCRLGNITGSECGKLMTQSRKKDEVFGETAKSYLYRLAAERSMNPMVVSDDDLFSQYVAQHQLHTKAVLWGQEQEDNARETFETIYNMKIEETGSVRHPTIPHFAASPDGVIYTGEGDRRRPISVVEFKSPGQETFMRYAVEAVKGEDLKRINPIYYWQCMAEMMCLDVKICWFTVFCPWQRMPLVRTLVIRNDEDAALLEERIRLANDFIDAAIKTSIEING